MDITQMLDLTTSREKLLQDAKGTWRIGTIDVSMLVFSAIFFYLFATHPDSIRNLVFGAGGLAIWRMNRIDTRLDAIVKLLDREG